MTICDGLSLTRPRRVSNEPLETQNRDVSFKYSRLTSRSDGFTTMRPLPDANNVLRYVAYGRTRKDEDGNIIGLLPQAFELRPQETYLSITWVEFFDLDPVAGVPAAVRAFRGSLETGPGKRSVFALANVNDIKEAGAKSGVKLRLLHRPSKSNPGHSGIDGVTNSHADLQELLASETFATTLIPNASIP